MTRPVDRAYLDRPVTDLDAAWAGARRAAAHWRLGEPELLRMGMNAIFVTGDHVLRLGTPSTSALSSLELAVFLDHAGLRVPQPARDDVVETGGLSATCWERVLPSGDPIDWTEVGTMVRALHSIDPSSLPSGVPLPTPDVLPWWDFDSMLARADARLDDLARAGIVGVVDRHRGWATFDGRVVCHGDVHPGNVVMTSTGAVLLDWDLLCWAPPGWDHAALLTWADRWGGEAGAYADFATGYGASLVDEPAAVAFAELRLVAATLMRLIAGIANPAAMPEAERRLQYWRGDPAAPMWVAQ